MRFALEEIWENPSVRFEILWKKVWQLAGVFVVMVCFFVFSLLSVIKVGLLVNIFTEIVEFCRFWGFSARDSNVCDFSIDWFVYLMTILMFLGGFPGGIEKRLKFRWCRYYSFIIIFIAAVPSPLRERSWYRIIIWNQISLKSTVGNTSGHGSGLFFAHVFVGWDWWSPLVPIWIKKISNMCTIWKPWIAGDGYCGLPWWAVDGAAVPALFALWQAKILLSGPAVVFLSVLPKVFDAMPGGKYYWWTIFHPFDGSQRWLLRSLLLEVQLLTLIDDRKWSRKKATWM